MTISSVQLDERPALEFSGVRLTFPGEHEMLALDQVSFCAPTGKITTVVGPSGCGKTTLLRLASGLVQPTSGRVSQTGRLIERINTGIGFVTQESNLFPWLTAIQNVEFPLLVRGVAKDERLDRAAQWLKTVGLSGFENYYPSQLSGGMQKRVAIIRTLIYEPEIVLFDEPFSALDAQTRMSLHHELLRLWGEKQTTMLFITHDLVEAITLSDQIVIMTRRPGTVKMIYDVPLKRPRNVFEIFLEPGFDQAYSELWSHFRSEL